MTSHSSAIQPGDEPNEGWIGMDLWDRWEGPSIPGSRSAMLKANRQVH